MPASPGVNVAGRKKCRRPPETRFNARPRRATVSPGCLRAAVRRAGKGSRPAAAIIGPPRAPRRPRPPLPGGAGRFYHPPFPPRPPAALPPRRARFVPTRPPRLRPLLLALAALPAAALAVEVGVRAYDSHAGGALSRPPCPHAQAVPCPLARHALPAHGVLTAVDPATGEPHACRVGSLGVRGGEPAVPKPAGTVRVLILGDEAALAAHLPREHTFAGRLEPPLARSAAERSPGTRTEIINAAVPGDCPLLSVLRLRALACLEPDVILLCVRPSDLAEDARYRRDLLTDDAGRPVACPHPAFTRPGGCETMLPWWRRSLAARLLARRAAACAAPGALPASVSTGPADGMAADLALAPLAELARVKDELRVNAAVVILPESPASAFADDRPAADLIRRAAAAAGLPAYDAAAALAAADTPPAELMHPGGAFTAAGNGRLAAGLAAFLLAPRDAGPAANPPPDFAPPAGPPPAAAAREPRPPAL